MRTTDDLSASTRAMLADMAKRGPVATTQIDPTIPLRTMANRLYRLRAQGFLSSEKLENVNLCMWQLTAKGLNEISLTPVAAGVPAAVRSFQPSGNWVPSWMPIRSGAMAAFEVPSVGLPT